MNLLIPVENAEIILNAQSTMKTFAKLGTSLFVSVIGLQTGFSIKNNSKNSMIAFAIGALMSMSGVIVMLLISMLDKAICLPSLLGILCGALTSTPGLSSVRELLDDGSEKAVVGYGCSYLLGVMFAVFFAQLFSKKASGEEAQAEVTYEVKSKIYPELMLISATALLGDVVGNIKIVFSNISLGATASTLTVGLMIGLIANKAAVTKRISVQCLNIFKNLGLALFFAGTGFTTGTQTIAVGIKTVLYGALITLAAILMGWLLCKIVSTQSKTHSGFIIAGGMTSSPAYGAISSKATETAINFFSFAYLGALVSLIVAIQILSR